MKKILIINLRRLGDVFSTAHLLNSLAAEPGTQVSMICYKESVNAAKNLKNLSEVFLIDRKEIITLKTNKLFSDGFAFERLFAQIAPVKEQEWDQIINYSNDPVGTYLTSYLKTSSRDVVGVHYNEQRNLVTKSEWELLFNDILPIAKYAPIHFVDCYHRMTGTAPVRDGVKIVTNTKYNEEAFSNINSLRKASGSEGTAKVIAIQLKTADASKDIPENTIVDFLSLLNETPNFIPMLLIAPNEEERKAALAVNARHNNEIITVEADLEAVASVLMNVDLLVTPDTAIKHMADLTETPVLEVSLGFAPFLKQGSYSRDSLILSDVLSERQFSQKNASVATNISAHDMLASVLYFFSRTSNIKPRLSNGVTLYKTSFDELGISYCPIAGTIDSATEIHRLMTRQLINVLYANGESAETYNDVCSLDLNVATEWVNNEKAMVTSIMRDLLGTLRSLLQCVENRKSSKEFVINLGRLITHAETESMIQIPAAMFKTKIESINAKTFEENTKEVEVLLYELKTDMQKILLCIKKLEEQISSQKMEKMVSKNLESLRN
jgi:ADP-heptose:LPS heptosyltransferase